MRISIRVPRFPPGFNQGPWKTTTCCGFWWRASGTSLPRWSSSRHGGCCFYLEILREMMICSLRKDRKVMNSKIWIYSFCMFLLFQGKCEENYDAICITDWPCHLQRGDPIGSTIKCIPETNPASDGVDTTKIMMNGCYSNCLVVSNMFF